MVQPDPPLVIHGELDPMLPIEQGRRLAQLIPSAKALFLPNVGHVLLSPRCPRHGGDRASPPNSGDSMRRWVQADLLGSSPAVSADHSRGFGPGSTRGPRYAEPDGSRLPMPGGLGPNVPSRWPATNFGAAVSICVRLGRLVADQAPMGATREGDCQ